MTFCSTCGKEMSAGSNFCPTCGARIQSEPAPYISPTATPAPITLPKVVKKSHFILASTILALLLVLSTAGLAYQTLRVQTLQQENSQLRIDLANPTLTIWNDCGGSCTMSAGSWMVGGVPDTFDYYVSFTATVPVAVYFFSISQYVEFSNCGGSVSCVTSEYHWYSPRTSLSNGVFTLAEGCASYVAVFKSAENGVMYPDVKVTYNPASAPTGACA